MIDSILAWAGEQREQAVFLVPLLAFMETCVGVGLFVPSLTIVIVTSVFYAMEVPDVRSVQATNQAFALAEHGRSPLPAG